ncbi:MAG: arginine N-succinyltransferase [Rhodothalassiaceae bacterium]
MLFLRSVREDDLETLYALSLSTGGGLTTLPPSEAVLAKRIAHSIASFAADVKEPGDEYYLFAAEETEHGEVVGTSGIFAAVGLAQPFYSYRLLHLTQQSHEPEKKVDTKLLQLVNDYAGATEIGTLFLRPDHRRGTNGALLSKARYLMMAGYPKRFADIVMAEIRGWVDDEGHSPFWNAIGRHFFGMDFFEADRLSGMGNSQFIADLMPKFPIYTTLLPAAAQAVIGKPHDAARGAVRLLTEEGFRFGGAVDIFDGGPCYEVPRKDIQTVRATRRRKVFDIADLDGTGNGDVRMVASSRLPDFRITRSPIADRGGRGIVLDRRAAEVLGISVGERVLTAPLRRKRNRV